MMTYSTRQRETPGALGSRRISSTGERPEAPTSGEVTDSLHKRVIHGAFWTLLFALINKVLTFAGQIALAWFLFPDDFGLAALALSVTFPASILSAGVLQAVLIQKQDRFAKLVGHVFWLGVTLHLLAGIIIAALAPLAGAIFHEPRIVPLVLLAALSVPLASLSFPYTAKLYIDLRFRAITTIQFGEGILQIVFAVLLALSGFGAFSIIIPQLLVRVYAAATYRLVSGPVPIGKFQPSQWAPLIRPSGWLMIHSLASVLQFNGVILAIRLFHDTATTGLFSWGNQIASQAILLLVMNLRNIFFPTLMKLNADPSRQRAAFLRAAKALTVVTVCLCIGQALLCPYLIPPIFGSRWVPAIPIVIWLTVGLSTSHLDLLVTSVLAAHQRNRALALLASVQTIIIVLAVLTTAALASGEATAAVLGVVTAATNILVFLQVFRFLSNSAN